MKFKSKCKLLVISDLHLFFCGYFKYDFYNYKSRKRL